MEPNLIMLQEDSEQLSEYKLDNPYDKSRYRHNKYLIFVNIKVLTCAQ
jgi:hypothetical protein